MDCDREETKDILRQVARNLATCAATIQALEMYAKKQGWDSKELLILHEQAKQHLQIVFDPLFERIERLSH